MRCCVWTMSVLEVSQADYIADQAAATMGDMKVANGNETRGIVLFFLFAILIASSLLPAATPKTKRKHLDQATIIQGHPCARDFAWFFPDGNLSRCTLSREFDFGEAHLPEGSIIQLFPNGNLRFVMLEQNTLISGVRCSGGGPLGPAEGAITVLYPSGITQELLPSWSRGGPRRSLRPGNILDCDCWPRSGSRVLRKRQTQELPPEP